MQFYWQLFKYDTVIPMFSIEAVVFFYNYLCYQYLSPLKWLVTGRWFSPGTPVSSTNNTDHHDVTEILLKVTLNTINLPPPIKKKNNKKTRQPVFEYLLAPVKDLTMVNVVLRTTLPIQHCYSYVFNNTFWKSQTTWTLSNCQIILCLC